LTVYPRVNNLSKNTLKDEMKGQFVTRSSKSEYKVFFVNFVKQLLLIKPNEAKDKLSQNAPLGKFIKSSNYKRFVLKKYLNSQKLSEKDEIHFFYKDQIAVELEIYFDTDELFKFTIIETLCAAPNTKDEINYFNWYPFKSKIVFFVDLNEQFFNILMKIENGSITVVIRDENEPYSPMDKVLVSALIANFEKVSVPSQFRMI